MNSNWNGKKGVIILDQITKQLLLIIFLISLNGFFAMAEIALITVKQSRLEAKKKRGIKKAAITLKLKENSNQFLSTIQIGITFAGFLASASTAAILSHPLAEYLDTLNLPLIAEYSTGLAVLFTTIFISYLSLVFGELVPKQIALQWTDKIALFVARPIKYLGVLAYPLVSFLSFSTETILKLIPGAESKSEGNNITPEDIKYLLNKTKMIKDKEKNMIKGIFSFGNTRVKEIMTPRPDIIYLQANLILSDILPIIVKTSYSRYPVIGQSIDNIKGIIHVRDIITALNGGKEINIDIDINNLIKPVLYIPESTKAVRLLKEFQAKNIHMAVVINEYGGTAGLITLEDLLEEIVGEIQDEYDNDDELINKKGQTITINGNTDIEYINRQIGTDIPDIDEYETIAGFILYKLNHIPEAGEKVKFDDWYLVVSEIRDNRIKKVEMIKNNKG